MMQNRGLGEASHALSGFDDSPVSGSLSNLLF